MADDEAAKELEALDKALEDLQEVKRNEELANTLREETQESLKVAREVLERRLAR